MDLAKIYFYLIQTKSHYLSEKTTINNITEKGKYEQENCLDKDCNSIFKPVLMKSDDSDSETQNQYNDEIHYLNPLSDGIQI